MSGEQELLNYLYGLVMKNHRRTGGGKYSGLLEWDRVVNYTSSDWGERSIGVRRRKVKVAVLLDAVAYYRGFRRRPKNGDREGWLWYWGAVEGALEEVGVGVEKVTVGGKLVRKLVPLSKVSTGEEGPMR